MADELENWINVVAKIAPWITDSTLEQAFGTQANSNLLTKKALAILRSNPVDFTDIVQAIEDGVDRNSAFNVFTQNLSDATSSIIRTFDREPSINAMGELAYDLSKGVYGAASALEQGGDAADLLRGRFKRFGNILDGVTDAMAAGAKLLVYSTAGSALAMKLLQDQEKTVRVMLDYGLVAGDVKMYSLLRENLAHAGMSVEVFLKNMSDYGPLFANISSSTVQGALDFSLLAKTLGNTKSFSKMGYLNHEFAKRLAEEAEILYHLQELDVIDNKAKERIAESFKLSTEFALGLANQTGIDRDQLLSARREAIDVTTIGIDKNYQYIIDNFGSTGPENISAGIGHLSMLMGSLTPDFADGTIQSLTSAVYDLNFDHSILNNLTSNVANTLNALGTDARTQFIEIAQTIITGGYDAKNPEKLTKDYLEFLTTVRDTPVVFASYIGVSPSVGAAKQLQDVVTTLPDSFYDYSLLSQGFVTNGAKTEADIASAVVDAVNDLGKFNALMKQQILPEYETTTNAINAFSGGLELVDVALGALGVKKEEKEIDSIDRNIHANIRAASARRTGLAQELSSAESLVTFNTILDQYLVDNNFTRMRNDGEFNKPLRDSESDQIILSDSEAESSLLDFIGSGEGGYNSSNRGTSGDRIVGSTNNTIRNRTKLTDLTFEQIFSYQSINNPNSNLRLFAVGKYQIIPSTLEEIWPHSGLALGDKFSPENQDKLGALLLRGTNDYAKRPTLAKFLRGDTSISVDQAMLAFSKEWASVPDPRTGRSYYGSGNKSSHSVAEVRRVLLQARKSYIEEGILKSQHIINPERQLTVESIGFTLDDLLKADLNLHNEFTQYRNTMLADEIVKWDKENPLAGAGFRQDEYSAIAADATERSLAHYENELNAALGSGTVNQVGAIAYALDMPEIITVSELQPSINTYNESSDPAGDNASADINVKNSAALLGSAVQRSNMTTETTR